MKVLIVDDEAALLASTSTLLQHLGLKVASVQEARDIVRVAVAERPDVILQDVRMPQLDLDELVRQIRERAELASTPVVLCSASMDVADIAQRTGVEGYLEKPYRPDELLKAIDEAAKRGVSPRGPGDVHRPAAVPSLA